MLRSSLAVAAAFVLFLAQPAGAAEGLDQRLAATGQTVDQADTMFRAAMKGHLPSLEVIKALRARMMLAEALYEEAKAAAAAGKADDADAKLDAADYLARQVFEASEH